MITNSAKGAAASSAAAALESIDEALGMCEEQMVALEKRGKTHLAAYTQVRERYRQMRERRGHLGHLEGGGRGADAAVVAEVAAVKVGE